MATRFCGAIGRANGHTEFDIAEEQHHLSMKLYMDGKSYQQMVAAIRGHPESSRRWVLGFFAAALIVYAYGISRVCMFQVTPYRCLVGCRYFGGWAVIMPTGIWSRSQPLDCLFGNGARRSINCPWCRRVGEWGWSGWQCYCTSQVSAAKFRAWWPVHW